MRLENVLFELDQVTATIAGLLRALRDAAVQDAATLAWAGAIAAGIAAVLTAIGYAIRRPSTRALLFGLRWPLGGLALLVVAAREPATPPTRLVLAGLAATSLVWAVVALLRSSVGWLRRRSVTPWQTVAHNVDLEQLKQRIGEEIARAKRRPTHPLTVVALRRVRGASARSRRAWATLRDELLATLRPYDAFAQDDDGTLYVLLPGADPIDAQAVVPRVRNACAAADPSEPSSDAFARGFAFYPDSGATVEELLKAASSGMTVGDGSQPVWAAALALE